MADKLNALAKAPVNALSNLYDAYQRRIGQPFQQAVRGGVRGYFGLPMMTDADALGREAYRQAEALGYTPGVGMPAGAVRMAAEGVQALPSIAGDIGRVIAGMPSGAGAAQAEDFARYQRSIPPSDVSPLTAYHGTPHTFAAEEGAPLGRFRSEKIGTGERAQAYGYGLYFAEAPGTAKGYQEKLSGSNPNVFLLGDKEVSIVGGSPEWIKFNEAAKAKGFSTESAALAYNKLKESKGDLDLASGELTWVDNPTKIQDDAANLLRSLNYKPQGGSFYTVDIPDSMVEKMLDWDKPLSQQPKSFQDMVRNLPRFQDPYVVSKTNGGEAYKELSGNFGGPAKASEMLRQAGIPGIRYLDAGSRGSADGTRNIVVFPGEESRVKILKRE